MTLRVLRRVSLRFPASCATRASDVRVQRRVLPRLPASATLPRMSRTLGTPTNVARALGTLAALDERGQQVALGPLWSVRPVVLAFVRQFG